MIHPVTGSLLPSDVAPIFFGVFQRVTSCSTIRESMPIRDRLCISGKSAARECPRVAVRCGTGGSAQQNVSAGLLPTMSDAPASEIPRFGGVSVRVAGTGARTSYSCERCGGVAVRDTMREGSAHYSILRCTSGACGWWC